MPRRSPALALTFALAAVAASAGPPEPGAEARERAKLQGIWVMAESVYNGEHSDARQMDGWLLVVEGDVYNPGREETSIEYTFRLDPTLTPKAIDLIPRRGPDEGRTYRGIYALDGDRLTVCRPVDAAQDRPAGFVVRPGSNLSRIVWRRRKAPGGR